MIQDKNWQMLNISVLYVSHTCNLRIALLVKYLCEKLKNFCKWIPRVENGTRETIVLVPLFYDHGNNTVPETFVAVKS